MPLDDAETELLKKWIIKKLESISDADSDVLADYVLALAKTDDPESLAKTNCVENLRDFLTDSTESFVNELFNAITTKSFDPSRPAPKPTAPVYQPPKRSSLEQSLQNQSRKRSYHDWDRDDGASWNGHTPSYQSGDRPVKQARRGGRGGRHAQTPTQANEFQPFAPPSHHRPLSQMPMLPPGMPQIDPNDPMAAMLAMQQAFVSAMQNGGSPPNINAFAPPRMAQRCRDYDTKGFCSQGASCPYEHGNDHFVTPGAGQEYDPNNAALFNITPSKTGQFNTSANERGRGGGRGRARGNNWRGGGKRAEFSKVGPNRDKSVTSIVIEQIPEDKCDEQPIREFFSDFGEIQEIDLQPEKKLAVVKFDSNEAARAAYESPKVVFDNRFVKIYWYRPDKIAGSTQDNAKPVNGHHESGDVDMNEEDKIDPVEFAKKQEEAQRKHEEAKKQREDAVKQREDLDAKLRQMDAERKKMNDLLAKKANKAQSPVAESPSTNGAGDSDQTKALKAQLAKLEAEAKSLGIDTESPTNDYGTSPSYRGRGGYRGRGRGRGFQPGFRGGWHGSAARGGAVMRLDNRSKTVAVTFADGSFDKHDEALRQYLLFNGLDSACITRHPDRSDTALVHFGQRFEGDNFMAAANKSELLHIGRVEMSWYKPTQDKVIISSGSDDSKMDTAEATDQQSSGVRGVTNDETANDEEDLDRWA